MCGQRLMFGVGVGRHPGSCREGDFELLEQSLLDE